MEELVRRVGGRGAKGGVGVGEGGSMGSGGWWRGGGAFDALFFLIAPLLYRSLDLLAADMKALFFNGDDH